MNRSLYGLSPPTAGQTAVVVDSDEPGRRGGAPAPQDEIEGVARKPSQSLHRESERLPRLGPQNLKRLGKRLARDARVARRSPPPSLAPYEYPREIAFVAEQPETATGKILRFRLTERERAQA